jgi:prepilin signal peptidase PulO-like enzyme (type II secretory pathway)
MLKQIIGGICFIVGLLIVIGFPWITQYQPEAIAKTGILLGLILMGIGFYLMKF